MTDYIAKTVKIPPEIMDEIRARGLNFSLTTRKLWNAFLNQDNPHIDPAISQAQLEMMRADYEELEATFHEHLKRAYERFAVLEEAASKSQPLTDAVRMWQCPNCKELMRDHITRCVRCHKLRPDDIQMFLRVPDREVQPCPSV